MKQSTGSHLPIKNRLPSSHIFGKSYVNRDSLFDAVAQLLNQQGGSINRTVSYSVKSLRLMCAGYVDEISTENTRNWVKKHFLESEAKPKNPEKAYQDYRETLQYCIEEIRDKQVMSEDPDLNCKLLCQLLPIRIHVLDIENLEDETCFSFSHRLIDKKGIQIVDRLRAKQLYSDE